MPDEAPRDSPDPRRSSSPYVHEALAVDADVVEESGRFVVYLSVVLDTGAVRRRVGDYPDRRRAEQAARILVRNASRHLGPA